MARIKSLFLSNNFVRNILNMENFTNSILLPDELPQVEKSTFNQLDKKYLKVMFIRLAVVFLFLFAGLIALIFLNEELPQLVIIISSIIIAVLLIYSVVITFLGFPQKGYLVRENDISYKKELLPTNKLLCLLIVFSMLKSTREFC